MSEDKIKKDDNTNSNQEGNKLNGRGKVYGFPPKNILHHYNEPGFCPIDPLADSTAIILLKILKQNGINAWVEEIKQGPTFRQYKLGFERGTLKSAVLKHNNDFAQNLCVASVRIIPPKPENPFIIIEVPNETRFTVGFDKMIDKLEASEARIPMALGMDVDRDPLVIDVALLRHMLLLGDTGSGKTICIHSLVSSILYSRAPSQVRFLIADLNDYELPVYNGIPHLLSPVITEPEKALNAMGNLCSEMERRMILFRDNNMKSIGNYNEYAKDIQKPELPYIVFIIDEYEQLMISYRKQFEYWIKRITTVAYFCGIHLIFSTKSLSKDIVSGVLSSNIPTVINFKIKDSDSALTMIPKDASNLLGRGDLLFSRPYTGETQRIQGSFIDPEISEIVEFFKRQTQNK